MSPADQLRARIRSERKRARLARERGRRAVADRYEAHAERHADILARYLARCAKLGLWEVA